MIKKISQDMDSKNLHSPETRWPKSNGMTVPAGYFDDFSRRMMACIPSDPLPQPRVVKRTFWQYVRPYVYMAAMFAGIWLMMNVFSLFGGGSSTSTGTPVSSSPLFAEVINANTTGYIDDYVSVSDYDLYNDLYESGFEISE